VLDGCAVGGIDAGGLAAPVVLERLTAIIAEINALQPVILVIGVGDLLPLTGLAGGETFVQTDQQAVLVIAERRLLPGGGEVRRDLAQRIPDSYVSCQTTRYKTKLAFYAVKKSQNCGAKYFYDLCLLFYYKHINFRKSMHGTSMRTSMRGTSMRRHRND